MRFLNTYLLLLLVKVFNDNTNKKIKRKERAKYDEKDEV